MGCGGSKFINKDEMGNTYIIYNPLHRRIEDLNPWRSKGNHANSTSDTTKQLLGDDDSNSPSLSGDGSNGHGQKSVSAPLPPEEKETEVSPKMYECVVKLPPAPQKMTVPEGQIVQLEAADNKNVKCGGIGVGIDEVATLTKENKEEKATDRGSDGGKKNNADIENVKEEEEEAMDQEEIDLSELRNREDSILFPGSPSFREYCCMSKKENADAADRDNNIDDPENLVFSDDDDDDDRQEETIDLRSGLEVDSKKEDGNVNLPPVDSTKKHVETEPEPEVEAEVPQPGKKSRKPRVKRFRMPMPRTGSIGVRNLWNVSSCSCSSQRAAERAS